MTGASVAAVLDTSALIVYSRLDGIAVGELLGEIEDDGTSLLGIPVTSFLNAFVEVAPQDRHRLVELATNPDRATVLLPLRGTDALETAHLLTDHDLQTAHCVLEVRRHLAQLATYDGDRVRSTLDDDLILDLVDP